MRILFTGASSFTGMWFVKHLAAAGHDVVMTFRGQPGDYDGLRRKRVELAAACGEPVYGCSFGDECFIKLAHEGGFDVLGHHAADVSNYKSADFDVSAALANNTRNLRAILAALKGSGCGRVVLTGSVFEPGEGAGSEGVRAFSPYGLSKGLTAQVVRFETEQAEMDFGKFVIPNPFGPYEEPRFTHYLVKRWREGKVPTVNTPAYVRDNIHVDLLARAYASFVAASDHPQFNPSGYVETQGAFAQRFALEMDARLDLRCAVELAEQTQFDEPRIRINTDPVDGVALGFDEKQAWDEVAAFYEQAES